MPTWIEFAWGAVLFKAMAGGDEDYCALIRNRSLLKRLRSTPETATVAEVRDHVVGFLNKWRTRLPARSAKGLLDAIRDSNLDLRTLAGCDLRSAALEVDSAAENEGSSVFILVARCYDRLCLAPRIGPTAASKVLHILCPSLFVMWDAAILEYYQAKDSTIDQTGSGYAAYLKRMQELSRTVTNDFEKSGPDAPKSSGKTPEEYLSFRLAYAVPKTLAKYVDEYNWITITNNVPVPPAWHPERTTGSPVVSRVG